MASPLAKQRVTRTKQHPAGMKQEVARTQPKLNWDLGSLDLLPPCPTSNDEEGARAHCRRRREGDWERERACLMVLQKDIVLNIKYQS